MDGRRHGSGDAGAQERSGDRSGEVVVVVGRQVLAVDQHVVDGLKESKKCKRKRDGGGQIHANSKDISKAARQLAVGAFPADPAGSEEAALELGRLARNALSAE